MALHGLRKGGIFLAGALGLVISGGEPAAGQSSEPIDGVDLQSGKLDGLGVSGENEAGLYLDKAVARQHTGLGAYSIDKADRNARLLPGLAGVAKQVQSAQKAYLSGQAKKGYSLADALAEALWRKQVVDALYRNPDGSLAKDIFE